MTGGSPAPSGNHLIIDATQEDRHQPRPPSKILDTRSFQVVVESEAILVGWYDDTHYLRFTTDRLEVVELATGAVSRTIPTPGLSEHDWRGVQTGPSDGLHPDGVTYAF